MTGMAPGWLKRRLTESEAAVYRAWERWDLYPGDDTTANRRQSAVETLAREREVTWRELHTFFVHLRRQGRIILEAIVDEGGFG